MQSGEVSTARFAFLTSALNGRHGAVLPAGRSRRMRPLLRLNVFHRRRLIDTGGSLPIDKVRQSPGVLIQIPLQLPLFVKDDLRHWIEDSRALALVLIVEFEDTGG